MNTDTLDPVHQIINRLKIIALAMKSLEQGENNEEDLELLIQELQQLIALLKAECAAELSESVVNPEYFLD